MQEPELLEDGQNILCKNPHAQVAHDQMIQEADEHDTPQCRRIKLTEFPKGKLRSEVSRDQDETIHAGKKKECEVPPI